LCFNNLLATVLSTFTKILYCVLGDQTAIGLLKAWYEAHRSRPYASDAEVRQLATECQLGVRQVQKWLSNRRRMDGNTRRRNRPAHNAKVNKSTSVNVPPA